MAHQSVGMAQTINEHYGEPNISNRPKLGRRKSSFSEALTKFTSNTFNRRRTDACIPSSTSSISNHHPSRIPTPAGVDRSASFFSTLNTFASKSTVSASEESPQLTYTKRGRKISERLAQTPFFSHQPQQQNDPTPKRNRESSIIIEHRGLMQPVHPPLPRSNTMANPSQSQQSSPHTPGFMRPTTSSARRTSTIGRSNTAAPTSMAGRSSVALQRQRNSSLRTVAGSDTPNKTPTQARRGQANPFPVRSDSLVSIPIKTEKTAPALGKDINAKLPDLPTDYSDGANFQVTNPQHAQEMPKAEEGENGKPKISFDHSIQPRRVPQPKESKKGILKSSGKNSKFSECFSNLYVDDDADGSKDGLDNDDISLRSEQDSPNHSERTATPESSSPRLIHEAQPAIWWLGRYTALSDRFRTGALPTPPPSPSRPHSSSPSTDFPSPNNDHEPSKTTTTAPLTPGSTSSTNANHPMHNAERRNRRVYIHLRSLCTTDEARASLDGFRAVMEAREKRMAGPQGRAVKEKQGWLEGLMGKRKKGEKS